MFPEFPIEPPEDTVVGYCKCCGGEIYAGEEFYRGDVGSVHKECIRTYTQEFLTPDFLAEQLGLERVILNGE